MLGFFSASPSVFCSCSGSVLFAFAWLCSCVVGLLLFCSALPLLGCFVLLSVIFLCSWCVLSAFSNALLGSHLALFFSRSALFFSRSALFLSWCSLFIVPNVSLCSRSALCLCYVACSFPLACFLSLRWSVCFLCWSAFSLRWCCLLVARCCLLVARCPCSFFWCCPFVARCLSFVLNILYKYTLDCSAWLLISIFLARKKKSQY